jgi:hypothetical protein
LNFTRKTDIARIGKRLSASFRTSAFPFPATSFLWNRYINLNRIFQTRSFNFLPIKIKLSIIQPFLGRPAYVKRVRHVFDVQLHCLLGINSVFIPAKLPITGLFLGSIIHKWFIIQLTRSKLK